MFRLKLTWTGTCHRTDRIRRASHRLTTFLAEANANNQGLSSNHPASTLELKLHASNSPAPFAFYAQFPLWERALASAVHGARFGGATHNLSASLLAVMRAVQPPRGSPFGNTRARERGLALRHGRDSIQRLWGRYGALLTRYVAVACTGVILSIKATEGPPPSFVNLRAGSSEFLITTFSILGD